jgi:hypothetical protein
MIALQHVLIVDQSELMRDPHDPDSPSAPSRTSITTSQSTFSSL